MSVPLLTPEQTLTMIVGTFGLTTEQTIKYAQLVPAMLTADGYAEPEVFEYQIDAARELAVWMTSNEFNKLVGGA
jgi:hypothetical protein